ncbi:MAG: hypothetical protein IKO44_04770 [Ruminococcus sp.]|nr:hypothetical protein [Ruminococcus sp.]MBR4622834.1 hypothetical protein [Ruminococcus sp.]
MRTKKHRFGKRLTALITVMCMIFTMLPINALAFNPDWYKTHIQSITIGKPATDTNGRKYLPVTVVFTADEDINDSNVVYFLEGYLKAKLANGKTAEGISGNGMTLVPVEPDDFDDAGINSYSWKWSQGGGKGAVKYKLPVLGASDTQTIEKSPYTGQKEVNGLKVGDEVTLSIETVFNKQNIPEEITKDLMSDEFKIVIEDLSTYPKTVEAGSCEHDGDIIYESNGETTHNALCSKCRAVLVKDVPHVDTGAKKYSSEKHWNVCDDCKQVFGETAHTLSYVYNDTQHRQKCSGCNYKSEAVDHEWTWIMNSEGIYTGQKCKCGKTRTSSIPGIINLGKSEITFPEGKDANSEFTKEEAESIGLKDDKGTAIDQDSYTLSVEPSKTDDSKWTVDFKSVEDKSINRKTVDVLKKCEHDGEYIYESTGPNFHDVKCAKCLDVIYSSLNHTSSLGKAGHDTEYHWEICDDCGQKYNEQQHTLTYKYDDDTHWQECSGCEYKTEAVGHEWKWEMDSDGIYTGQKCECGATRSTITGIVDLGRSEISFPDGKDENSEFNKEEAKNIGLKDESSETIDKDSYTVSVEKNKDDGTKWTVEFKSVEDKSIGKKEITVQRSEDSYYAAVTYVMAEGLTAPEGFIVSKEQTDLKSGQNYSIESPKYPGFKPSDAIVLGTIGSSDVEITVTYTACTHTNYTVTDFVKPTCTEDSDAVLAACDDCGKVLSLTAAEIHALGDPYVATGHNFDEEWHREYGISSKPGAGHYHKCQNPGCYERQYEAHVWKGEQKYGEKCGVDLYFEDECEICGAKYEYAPTECKLERTPEKDVAPTCEEYGFEKYVCTVCGNEASDAIAPLGHDMEVVEEEKADCEKEGYKLKKCKREGCDHEEKEIIEKLSKNGKHSWTKNIKVEPTCEGIGSYEGQICTVCGKTETAQGDYGIIDALGHNVITTKKNLGTKPGVTKNGTPVDITLYEVIYSCTRCRAHLGTEAWTVATAAKPPRYEIIPGRKAEITDLGNGIHVDGNMAQDGGVYFRDQVMKGFDDVVDSESAKSKYQYKKIKANSFIIEFSESFLAELEDGVYPVEVINGNEFWPLMVTVKDHKLTELADQEYPKETTLTNEEFAELLENAEAEGAEVKSLFVTPLSEEDLADIRDYTQPSLDNGSAEFDKNSPADIAIGVNEGSFRFDSVSLGGEALTSSDYSFADGKLVISSGFLAKLEEGEYVFDILFTDINEVVEPDALTFTVTVVDRKSDSGSSDETGPGNTGDGGSAQNPSTGAASSLLGTAALIAAAFVVIKKRK